MRNTLKIAMGLFVLFFSTGIVAQEKTKKQIKEERKIEQQKVVESLVATQKFVFEGNRAFPTGYRSIDLTTNPNFVAFSKDLIESDMPFFGRATGSLPYGGGDGGLKFKGIPSEFSVQKTKKNYQLKAKVKDENDSYTLNLTIFFDGGASLIITSNNRTSISYSGKIVAPQSEVK